MIILSGIVVQKRRSDLKKIDAQQQNSRKCLQNKKFVQCEMQLSI